MAFTLAEVLITLGIIGVVAAMTIPTLIHNYRAAVLRSQFLKTNSIVHEGILRMKDDDVDINDVINSRDAETIRRYFKTGSCLLPANEGQAKYYDYTGRYLAQSALAHDLVLPSCLANGQVLWLVSLKLRDTSNDTFSNADYSLIAVDINGWKNKPDKYGYDVFFWWFDSEKNSLGLLGPDYYKYYWDGGVQSKYHLQCPPVSATGSEGGIGCGQKAMNDPDYFKNLPK